VAVSPASTARWTTPTPLAAPGGDHADATGGSVAGGCGTGDAVVCADATAADVGDGGRYAAARISGGGPGRGMSVPPATVRARHDSDESVMDGRDVPVAAPGKRLAVAARCRTGTGSGTERITGVPADAAG
jgi:hypothetical protein